MADKKITVAKMNIRNKHKDQSYPSVFASVVLCVLSDSTKSDLRGSHMQ